MARFAAIVLISLGLVACRSSEKDPGTPNPLYIEPLEAALSGRTFERLGVVVHVNVDGTISGENFELGEPVKGTWEVKEGELCREIVSPKKYRGSDCQSVLFHKNGVTFIRSDGTRVTYKVRLEGRKRSK